MDWLNSFLPTASLPFSLLTSILVFFELPQKQNFNTLPIPPHTHLFKKKFSISAGTACEENNMLMLQQQKANCIMGTEGRFRPDHRSFLAQGKNYLQKLWHLSAEVCCLLMTDGRFRVRPAQIGGRWVKIWADLARLNSSNLLLNIAGVAHLCVLALQATPTCSNNHDVIHLLFGSGEGWWLMRRLGIRILSDLFPVLIGT